MSWVQTFAAYRVLSPWMAADEEHRRTVLSMLEYDLEAHLRPEFADRLTPTAIRQTDDIPRRMVVVLAELRALVRRNRSPFPERFDVFPVAARRWRRLRYLIGLEDA